MVIPESLRIDLGDVTTDEERRIDSEQIISALNDGFLKLSQSNRHEIEEEILSQIFKDSYQKVLKEVDRKYPDENHVKKLQHRIQTHLTDWPRTIRTRSFTFKDLE